MLKQTQANAEITVSLSALQNNLSVVRESLSGSQQVMAVVKANAYGHGDIEVARFLADKVEWFAVNTVEEGVKLREAGIENSILVFGVPEAQYAAYYVKHHLTATISDLSHFGVLDNGTDYHINLDTGMGRLGILPNEVPAAADSIVNHKKLNITGLYTHFATADDPGSKKVSKQYQLFQKVRGAFPQEILVHAANSGGVFFYPETHLDMIRSGIGLYGYPPGETLVDGLVPALQLQSRIVQVKSLNKGDSVSYGATWQASEDTNIGVIPVGYEDGIPRNLSNYLRVQIAGKEYQVAGTVTMNFCMVDLGTDHYEINTPVELINHSDLTASQWARHLHTIPYEVLTGLSRTIHRSYTR